MFISSEALPEKTRFSSLWVWSERASSRLTNGVYIFTGPVSSTETLPFSCIRLSSVMTVWRVHPVAGASSLVISGMERGEASHRISIIFHSASVHWKGMKHSSFGWSQVMLRL